MLNKILNTIFIITLIGGVYLYRDKLGNIWTTSYYRYFPCRSSIKYSLGEFDTRFGVSKEDFLSALSQAEGIWEKSVGKNLFEYSLGGLLKVNLVYDKRQDVTLQLKNMGVQVSDSKSSYDELKAKYDTVRNEYQSLKSSYDAKVSGFESRKTAYEQEVSFVNSRGGANKTTVNKLNNERDSINNEIVEIRQMQIQLNQKVDELNALASSLNTLAKKLNMTVDQYNSVGGSLGGEFEEGTYTESGSGRSINVYQFDDKTKLVRVLAHELGHALGLDHNDDAKAIMYRLNNGVNEKLTQTDIQQVKILCGIK